MEIGVDTAVKVLVVPGVYGEFWVNCSLQMLYVWSQISSCTGNLLVWHDVVSNTFFFFKTVEIAELIIRHPLVFWSTVNGY